MNRIRKRIEDNFEAFGRFVYHNPVKMILVMLALSVPLISQLPKITLDTSTESFLHKSDPELIAYYKFREEFGRDEPLIIAIKPPEIFNRSFLEKLKSFHEELKNKVPKAVRLTLLTTGRAMLITSIVLSTGFFIYMFASMNNLFNFGLLTGFTILMALLADFLLAPALMTLITLKSKS